MADMGATVLKVEPPEGDIYCHFDQKEVGYEFDLQTNYAFEFDNRGKKSVTLDLTKPGASDAVHRLMADADIFITNLIQRRRVQHILRIEDLQTVNQPAPRHSCRSQDSRRTR
jgi:crotonobetainyl-CoA:carnitine CoA-transferase CaiB-like acyl-CoA transferase